MVITISANNGIELCTSGSVYRMDPRKTVEGDINLVSHAHSDHLPRSGKELSIVASTETVALARLRTGKNFRKREAENVRLLDAGHIYGSSMFLIEEEARILYTGDFCTKQKVYLHRAMPQKVDVLIIESTYGTPRYRFPDPLKLSSVIREWVADALESGTSILFSCYPLGKAQELTHILSGMPLFGDESVLRHNRLLLKDEEVRPADEISGPAVLLSSRSDAMRGFRGLRAGASGWFLEPESRERMGLDEAFPLSDHCDFQDLMDFVAKCSPTKVYTVHGFAQELAGSIRRELGISAEPLHASRQSRIVDY